ncbi:MAG: class II fructose-bisphosphate aldolase [Elusimicrobiota bacterium]
MEVPEEVLAKRPQNFVKKLDEDSRVCCLNSKDILSVLKDDNVILMACNTRIKHVIPGIMRAAEELNAVVGFELAKSEGGLPVGYTGMNPKMYVEAIVKYAEEVGYTVPFYIHGDHITVKADTEEEIETSRELIKSELAEGYTSFAIDASYNEMDTNVRITTDLAQPIIEQGFGLEAEVGEIKGDEDITTVEDAVEYIEKLNDNGVYPDMLAINNGSKHGNYDADEEVHIDLERTQEIYNAIKDKGVVIAQHGITGTPLNLVGQFADHGIRKGNVGTNWQNIAHEHLPEELVKEMTGWSDETGSPVKHATKQFYDKLDNIPEENKKAIADAAYESAKDFIKAFRSDGTASKVVNNL